MSDNVQYELKSVKTLRGTESRSIAKWQKEGWELVDQSASTLHTTLTFRRVKPKVPWPLIAGLAGVVLLLAVIGGIASLFQGGDDMTTASTSPAAEPSQKSSKTPRPEASESSEPTSTPTPESIPEQNLTPENNPEFAALLASTQPCAETVEAFAVKYDDRTIEFDASISFMANHENRKTRYDFLISPGDQGAESTRGPNFKFEDVGILDLKLTGPNVPDAIGVGDLLRVAARIDDYNPTQCLFFLNPISTRIR